MNTEYQGMTRTFTAETYGEVKSIIKREMGSDVAIVSQKTVRRGGFLGFGGRSEVEVIARMLPRKRGAKKTGERLSNTADSDSISARGVMLAAQRRLKSGGSGAVQAPRARRDAHGWVDDSVPEMSPFGGSPLAHEVGSGTYGPAGRRRQGVHQTGPGKVPPPVTSKPPESDRLTELFDQLAELKAIMNRTANEDVAERHAVLPSATAPAAGFTSPLPRTESNQTSEVVAQVSPGAPGMAASGTEWLQSPLFGRFQERLVSQGVPESVTRGILERVAKRTTREELEDRAVVESRIAKEIAGMIKIAPALEPHPEWPRVVVAVGPTGVGKTTTLAKLGGIYFEEEQFSVAYLTLDNYRVAAAEQLRSYSDIIGVTFEEIASAEELKDAVERNMDKDFIFVDTAGRSPYAHEAIDELKRTLSALSIEPHVLLLVSASTSPEDMEAAIRSFKICDRIQLVFTKLDETQRWGGVFTAATRAGLPVAYCTTGQSVPADIEPALASRFADEVFLAPGRREERGRGGR